MAYLQLQLERVPDTENWDGVYRGNVIPPRMRILHPSAVPSFLAMSGLVLSDMFREPGDSLRARQQGRRGVQPPGFSLHNYGIAIDIDIPKSRKGVGAKNKTELDEYLALHGWWCHRNDHQDEHEAWHYNFLGVDYKPKGRTTQRDAEALITSLYPQMKDGKSPAAKELQIALASCHLYTGEIDGKFGPLSKKALSQFQKAWGLPDSKGVVNYKTWRTLIYVTADRVVR